MLPYLNTLGISLEKRYCAENINQFNVSHENLTNLTVRNLCI